MIARLLVRLSDSDGKAGTARSRGFAFTVKGKVEYDVKEIRYPWEFGLSTLCHEDSEVSG